MKNRNIKIMLLALVFGCFSFISSADDISISASVDKNEMSMDDQLTLQVVISGNAGSIPEPQLPKLEGFTPYSSGRSQNIQIINGKVSASLTFNYTLAPGKPGTYIIGPVTLNYKGKVYQTNPMTIKVVKGSPASSQKIPENKQPESIGDNKGIFVTTSTDKKQVCVNEPVNFYLRFYRSIRLLGNPQYTPPDFTGFWIEDLPPQREYYTTADGVRYLVTEVRAVLFPMSSGKYTIGSASLICNIEDIDRSKRDSFDDFFKDFFSRGKAVTLRSKPIEINVSPLPEKGKPSNFKGTAGEFNLTAEIDKAKLKTGEPLTLSVTITGKGNIKTISEPVLPELNGFKKYDTISSFNISKDNYILKGSKTFKTVLIPQVKGKLEIPEIKYSYFDTKDRVYKTLSSRPITVNVEKGDQQTITEMPVITPEGVKVIGKDIRYISIDTKFNKTSGEIYKNKLFLLLQLLPVLILVLSYRYVSHTERLQGDIKYARSLRASKVAKKHLKSAEKFMNIRKVKEFYTEISNALSKYLADRFNISAAGMKQKDIKQFLVEREVSDDLINNIVSVMEKCDFARFAPSTVTENEIKKDYEDISELIAKLEKILAKNRK